MQVLIVFRHGLGDALQLTTVLKHLKAERPTWAVDVLCQVGKHTAFFGLCRQVFWARESGDIGNHLAGLAAKYDQVYDLDWWECRQPYGDSPSTKAEQCLRDVFGILPRADLWDYSLQADPAAQARARTWLGRHAAPREDGRFPVMLLHYQGNTSPDQKNLTDDTARTICDAAIRCGLVPVILDWEQPLRSPLPDGRTIFNPHISDPLWAGEGTGDAATLAALIEASALMVGIDSGPLHVAGATTTPTIAVWTKNHPVHYFSPAGHVLHLIPPHHSRLAAGDAALQFFAQAYRSQEYRRIGPGCAAAIENLLTGSQLQEPLAELRACSYGPEYYAEHRDAGLDYLVYGDWQRDYGRWIVGALGVAGKRLLDVGCACGAIVRGFGEAGAITQGVDVNEYMITLAKGTYRDFEKILFVCDAVNLHLFPDASWDGLHSAQVAEHWRPDLVPFILRELWRVTAPGGRFFCALDTSELFARQGRKLELEDPTHICIQPMSWWHAQLQAAGWELCAPTEVEAFARHPGSYIPRYDWDWWLARKPA